MIRTLIALIPADRRGKVGIYAALTLASVVIRAAGTVLLIPWWRPCSATCRATLCPGWAGSPPRP